MGWAFAAPYLTLMRPDAPQRVHDLREVFDALRRIVRASAPWRPLPTDFPPWEAVYQQTRRWIEAGCFEEMTHDAGPLPPPLTIPASRPGPVLAVWKLELGLGVEAWSTWRAGRAALVGPPARRPRRAPCR